MTLNFKKMHGLGNDFVIFDGRENGLTLTSSQVRKIADRKRGIGCDLVALMKHSKNWQETTFVHLINADGSEIEACGNATRCVADILMREDKVDSVIIETVFGSLNCWRDGKDQVRVEMGIPKLSAHEIPLSKECDTLFLEGLRSVNGLRQEKREDLPVAVSMGNPHCVFFIEASGAQARYGRLEEWPDEVVTELGQRFETDPLFPKKTNVEFVEVLAPDHLRMRVWERGVGITEACGSGACAVAVAAIRRGLTKRKMTVTLDGGDLVIDWPSNESGVFMTGPVAYVFDGTLEAL